MKIQEFADLFNIRKSTVRYYRDINLIIPERVKNYCDFGKDCIKDMQDILELKEMGFSIEKIQSIKAYERLMVVFDDKDKKVINEIAKKKIFEHKQEMEKIQQRINMINKYIKMLEKKNDSKPIGISIAMLDYLCCPYCKENFVITDATIESHAVHSGIIECSCGCKFNIKNGILICDDNLEHEAFDKKDNKFLLDDPYSKITMNHILINNKMGKSLKKHLNLVNHEDGIIFYYSDTDILMMKLHELFEQNGKYVFVSFDFETISKFKNRLEILGIKGNFMFILTKDVLPLTDSIPCIVDNSSNMVEYLIGFQSGYSIQLLNQILTTKTNVLKFRLTLPLSANTFKKIPELKKYITDNSCNKHLEDYRFEIKHNEYIGDINDLENLNSMYDGEDSLKVSLLLLSKLDLNKKEVSQ
ncbi:MerR family transcriptional regulator [Clostridiaceae bacterium M8S5]|nr:MerR family transcriptional regulator [Clostridiaceae bacterium M8S5]